MAVSILRTVLIYSIIVIAMRLMGKKQLGELQPSELVSTILISNLASIPIESPEIPLISSVIPVLLIASIEIILSNIAAHNHKFAAVLSGRPKVIIRNGQIDKKILKELRFTVDDLLEALRAKDIFDLREVNFALVETNGTVSVYKTSDNTEVTRGDLQLDIKTPSTPYIPLIIDGEISYSALSTSGVTVNELNKILADNRVCADDIMLLCCNGDKEVQLIKKGA